MKNNITLLTLIIYGCLAGCRSNEPVADILTIQESLLNFEASIPSRSPNTHYCETIFTSKGAFSIGTQEAILEADGVIHYKGKSRVRGYFVVPPMRWVDSLGEAESVFIQEYEKNGGHTYQSKFHNTE